MSGDTDSLATIRARMDKRWNEGREVARHWRQTAARVLHGRTIDAMRFSSLFPDASLPHHQYAHGFPFVHLPRTVYSLEHDAWTGTLPPASEIAPRFLWCFTREGEFAYREKWWETDEMSVTQGQLHINSLFTICLGTTYFLKRLIAQIESDQEAVVPLALDIGGLAKRGLVANHRSGNKYAVDETTRSSDDDAVSVSIDLPTRELIADPLRAGLRLTSEAVLRLRPDLASEATLRTQLKMAVKNDQTEGEYRWLGFIDPNQI